MWTFRKPFFYILFRQLCRYYNIGLRSVSGNSSSGFHWYFCSRSIFIHGPNFSHNDWIDLLGTLFQTSVTLHNSSLKFKSCNVLITSSFWITAFTKTFFLSNDFLMINYDLKKYFRWNNLTFKKSVTFSTKSLCNKSVNIA